MTLEESEIRYPSPLDSPVHSQSKTGLISRVVRRVTPAGAAEREVRGRVSRYLRMRRDGAHGVISTYKALKDDLTRMSCIPNQDDGCFLQSLHPGMVLLHRSTHPLSRPNVTPALDSMH